MKTLIAAVLGIITVLLTPASASADGGFFVPDVSKDINEPAQKAIILHEDNVEVLILQVKYEGDVDEFAWVVPVPGYPAINVSEPLLFEELAYLTYVSVPKSGRGVLECGGIVGHGGIEPPSVTVWEEATAGVYDYAVLSAEDPDALIDWLNSNGYAFPEDGRDIIDHYIGKDWYFVAVKIDAEGEAEGWAEGMIQPLKLSFDSDELVYPLRITSLSSDRCEVLLYVFADQKVIPAEYPFLTLNNGEQIKYLDRRDDVFYLEYSGQTHLDPQIMDYWEGIFTGDPESWKEQYSQELPYIYPEGSYYFLCDLLGGTQYYLTKMRANISADNMADIELVAYDVGSFPDLDGDGWSDTEEAVAGTSPHRADTDYDGLADPEDPYPSEFPGWAIALIVISSLVTLLALWLMYRRRMLDRLCRFLRFAGLGSGDTGL